VARFSRSIAVSTTRCQKERDRLCAIRQAEERPMILVLRSPLIVRSQDWRRRSLGRRQSSGRRLMKSWSAGAWSYDRSAWRIWSNSLRRLSRMILVSGDSALFCSLTDCQIWDMGWVGYVKNVSQAPLVKSIKTSPGCDSHRPHVSTVKQNWEDVNVVQA